jgi:lon-related putative ATP-dependent protease
MVKELPSEKLFCSCEQESFEFKTTADLQPHSRIIGQPRGTESIVFGLGIDSPGYNIYVLGESGTGRTTAIERFIAERAVKDPVPHDWAYVHNFAEPHKPRALQLAAGEGRQLCRAMQELIDDLRTDLPKAFDTDEFRTAVHDIEHDLETGRDSRFTDLQGKAKEVGTVVVVTPGGLQILPVNEKGQPIPPEAMAQLPKEVQQAWKQKIHTFEHEVVEEAVREIQTLEIEAKDKMRKLVRSVGGSVVERALSKIKKQYGSEEEICTYLDEVNKDILENTALFRPPGEDEEDPQRAENRTMLLRRYGVNLITNNGDREGAPVVTESNPGIPRLLGRIEHEARRGGGVITDFSLIRAGALHAANGGYLVLRAKDLFAEPGAWEALKRALITESIDPDDPATRGGAPTRSLDPEPIPLDLKVILVGPSQLYYWLHDLDEDFTTVFKVMSDFDERMERTPENEMEYAIFVATRCKEEKLLPFDRGAVARVIEHGSRLADSQSKLSTRFGVIADLLRESSYWAQKADQSIVTAGHVQKAIAESNYRRNRVEDRLRERVLDGTLLIATEGEAVGQINGLAISMVGDHRFGQPSRVTARTYMGKDGVVQIDREVNLAGPIHNKGVMTLVGYLGGRYASDQPLSLSAQITFEQNYGGVEGDSASLTEVCSLLSSLSAIPIKQALAVTGSVDQRGDVQAIGGVSEKVEGWFAICKERGLSGDQGVVIPKSNVSDLMLNEDVRKAVDDKKFHVWAIDSVDEGLEVLTGRPAKEVHDKASGRLRELAEGIEAFGKKD